MTNNLSIGVLNTRSLFYDYSGVKVVFDPLVQAKCKQLYLKGLAFHVEKLNGRYGIAVLSVDELSKYQYKS